MSEWWKSFFRVLLIPANATLGYKIFESFQLEDIGLMAGVLAGSLQVSLLELARGNPPFVTPGFKPARWSTVAATTVLFVCTMMLMIHPFLLSDDPADIAPKMIAVEPVATFLALFFPGIDYWPLKLSQVGQGHWSLGARYGLVIGIINLMLVIASAVVVMWRLATDMQRRVRSTRWRQLTGIAFGLSMAFYFSWVGLYGAALDSGLRDSGPLRLHGLPTLNGYLFLIAFGVVIACLSIGDLLRGQKGLGVYIEPDQNF